MALTDRVDRSETQGLADECADVREAVEISERGHPGAADYGVKFFLGFLLDFWVEEHSMHEPR